MLRSIADDIVQSVNFHVKEALDEDATFDPKIAFKSRTGVNHLEQDVIKQSRRQARRDPDYLFFLEG